MRLHELPSLSVEMASIVGLFKFHPNIEKDGQARERDNRLVKKDNMKEEIVIPIQCLV